MIPSPSGDANPMEVDCIPLLLLTPRGAEICSGCFLNKDVKEFDYDCDSAPGLDLNNVYKPPILRQHVNHGNDIHLRSTGKDDDKVQ
jgi:hypothetical protein